MVINRSLAVSFTATLSPLCMFDPNRQTVSVTIPIRGPKGREVFKPCQFLPWTLHPILQFLAAQPTTPLTLPSNPMQNSSQSDMDNIDWGNDVIFNRPRDILATKTDLELPFDSNGILDLTFTLLKKDRNNGKVYSFITQDSSSCFEIEKFPQSPRSIVSFTAKTETVKKVFAHLHGDSDQVNFNRFNIDKENLNDFCKKREGV